MTEVVVEELEEVIKEKIKRVRGKDKEVVKVVKEIKKTEVRNLRGNEWKIERDLMLKKEKIYVLKNEELRVEIIQLHHNILVVGYGGR